MIRSAITHNPDYMNYSILANRPRINGCYVKLLDHCRTIQDHTVKRHSKVYTLRLDVRFPEEFPEVIDNDLFVSFVKDLMKYLNRDGKNGKKLNAHYFWRREQKSSLHPHYHLCLWINGNNCNSEERIVNTAVERWYSVLNRHCQALSRTHGIFHQELPMDHVQRLIHICENVCEYTGRKQYGILIDSDSDSFYDQFDEAHQAFSYLCKVGTNQIPSPSRVREYGYSQDLR